MYKIKLIDINVKSDILPNISISVTDISHGSRKVSVGNEYAQYPFMNM